jgi:hypothetical protein
MQETLMEENDLIKDEYNKKIIDLILKAMPNKTAYDICGVQNMQAPIGSIFASYNYNTFETGMRAHPNASMKELEDMGYHD